MQTQELLQHFLPEGILDYFELTEIKDSTDKLTLILEKVSILTSNNLVSK